MLVKAHYLRLLTVRHYYQVPMIVPLQWDWFLRCAGALRSSYLVQINDLPVNNLLNLSVCLFSRGQPQYLVDDKFGARGEGCLQKHFVCRIKVFQ